MPAFTNAALYDGMRGTSRRSSAMRSPIGRPGPTGEVEFDTTQQWAGIPFRFSRGASTDFPAASILIGGKVYYTHWAPAEAHANPLQISSPAPSPPRSPRPDGHSLRAPNSSSADTAERRTPMPLRFKIGYLECVERLLAANDTADEFARALRAAYPELPDEAAAAALAQALYADL